MARKKISLLNEDKGQAKILLIMILVPIALVLFLVMLTMTSPILDMLWPQIDTMSADGYVSIAGTLKMFISLIPTIVIMLYLYSIVSEVTQG
jgi:uncharacterized BrkB/YihY/UPF0761 family membrane protein